MSANLIFEPVFSDLNISPQKVIKMVGGGDADAISAMNKVLTDIYKEAEVLCKPLAYILLLPVESIDLEAGVIKCGSSFSVGKKIANYLSRSSSIAVFTCTIGEGLENWSRELMAQGDYLKAYMIDALGSIAVEKAMDMFQKHLKTEMQKEGLKITNRYSPGYCDWHVSEQQKLFALMPDDVCSVRLSESSLMHPIKSVSGFIGVGSKVSYKSARCEDCSSVDCAYRFKK